LEEIGFRSHVKAEVACRTESNFHDVRSALKELSVSLDDLYMFAAISDELPFNKHVPQFPAKKVVSTKDQTLNDNNNESQIFLPHIPKHLPPLPEPHTFMQTAVFDERVSDARLIRKRKSKEKRQVETSLAKLHEKLGNKPIINYDTARKGKGNPYLSAVKVRTKESKSEFKESVPTALKIVPTPLQKGLQRKEMGSRVAEENEENKKIVSELEESERLKKKQRAEQILDLQYNLDIVDHELPVKNVSTNGDKM